MTTCFGLYLLRQSSVHKYPYISRKRYNNTGRFIMYTGITKIYYRKTVGTWFFSLEICQIPGIRPTIATWLRWPNDTDHYSSEEYRCTHVDACVARTWISYRCVPCLDRLCGLVVRVSRYRYRGPGFDYRRYQIFWVVVGLERGPLSLVRSIEELLD
jgi:hypothetical protein